MTDQAIYNSLVAALCDRSFFTRHHVSASQIDDFQQQLEKLWFNPKFRTWITTFSRNEVSVSYYRVLAYFGFIMDNTYYLRAIKKSDFSIHLWNHCPMLHHFKDVKGVHYALRSSKIKSVSTFCCNVGS